MMCQLPATKNLWPRILSILDWQRKLRLSKIHINLIEIVLLSSFQRRFLACQVWTYDLNIVSESQKPIWWNSGFICTYLKSWKCVKMNVHPPCKPQAAKRLVLLNGNFLQSANLSNQITLPFHLLGITRVCPSRPFANCFPKIRGHLLFFDLICLNIAYVTMRGISVGMMESVYPDPEHIHRPQETNVFKLPFVVEAVAETRVTKKYVRPVVVPHCSTIGRHFAGTKSLEYVHVGVTGVTCSSSFFSFKLNLFAVVNASHANRVVVNCSKYIRLSWKRWLVPNRTNHQYSVNVHRFVKSQKIWMRWTVDGRNLQSRPVRTWIVLIMGCASHLSIKQWSVW